MIKIDNITKAFGDKLVFENFSDEIGPNEFIGIYGKSGAGKTTLLNMIGTLEAVDKGDITILDKDIKFKRNKKYLLKHELGFVFQNYALVDNEDIKYNLMFGLRNRKLSKKEKETAIIEVLHKVGLDGFENKKIYTLSGGEQQRVAIARILLKNPSIILADEPTGSLDNESKEIIINLLKELHQAGKIILVVTHDNELLDIFTRVIKL